MHADINTVSHVHELVKLIEETFVDYLEVIKICFQNVVDINCPQLLVTEFLPWIWMEVRLDVFFDENGCSLSICLDLLCLYELDVGQSHDNLQELESVQLVRWNVRFSCSLSLDLKGSCNESSIECREVHVGIVRCELALLSKVCEI